MRKHRIKIFCIFIFSITISLKLYEKYMTLYGPQNYMPPLSIMVNDTLYWVTSIPNNSNANNIVLAEPTGTIKDIINKGFPIQNDQANFGVSGMEYWLIELDTKDNNSNYEKLIYIKIDDLIYAFKPYKESVPILPE